MCLNSVAIVFILEVDNAVFALGIAERVRARVEAKGRVQLSDEDAAVLARTKPLHVCLVVVYLVGSALAVSKLYHATNGSVIFVTFIFGPHAPFWIGALAEAGWKSRMNCTTAAVITGAWIFGSVLSFASTLAAVSA